MKIRDSVSKETLKQFKSIAPGSNRKKKSWERDTKRINDKAAVSGENDKFWEQSSFGCMAAGALVRDRSAKI